MSSSSPSHLFSVSAHLQSTIRLRTHSSVVQGFKVWSLYTKRHSSSLSSKRNAAFQNTRQNISCAVHVAAGSGQSGDPQKINLDRIMDGMKKIWDSFPQPVKIFPWTRALDNFIQLILDLILAVVKYLCVPLLAVTSLSEMSYCAHERKLFLIPFPLLVGFAVAGVLKETALELSPHLKDVEVPWHLLVVAIFFTLLKLPGPYYPYWGRIFIPHFANGGLLRILWFAVAWYGRPRKALETIMHQNSVGDSYSEPDKTLNL
ncbi:uncharacterized protein LOC131156692 [Malania oleifera]|uniref:uncharacterized protein LOC131156692 n=1 Tax=Malania oleifera TaxID=397392 RepID=UPI0025ADA938|nr:uncharacterized protein LOC131156692 [Malania oleifera]